MDFDSRYASDFQELAELGLNSYRFSLSWARLFPRADMTEPDPDGVAFYQDVIAAAKANGLEPHVSLFHFSTPEWFWEEQDGNGVGSGPTRDPLAPLRSGGLSVTRPGD